MKGLKMERVKLVPCNRCRAKHLKCDDNNPCTHCHKPGEDCIRARKRVRFSKTKRFDGTLGFSHDQTWMKTTNKLSFVDVTPRGVRSSKRFSVHQANQSTGVSRVASSETNGDQVGDTRHVAAEAHVGSGSDHASLGDDAVDFSSNASVLSLNHNVISQEGSASEQDDGLEARLVPKSCATEQGNDQNFTTSEADLPITSTSNTWDSAYNATLAPCNWSDKIRPFPYPHSQVAGAALARRCATSPLVTAVQDHISHIGLEGQPEGSKSDACLQLREACLLRHYVDNLAPWFEITDRDRHYSIVVPQRATFCPVLLNAVYTASARHMTRLWHKRYPGTTVEFDGILLPGLDDHTAIHYHNKCIGYLIEISNDPAQNYNEDALTAATILRFYEQIDAPLTGQDTEIYLHVVRTVVESQQDESFYAIRKIHGPLRDVDPYLPIAVSLRHSAYLIALRQEIWSALLYHRPLQLPICPNNDYQLAVDPPPADDFVWANRILVWTADVVKFCFGGIEIKKPGIASNNPSLNLNVDSKSRVEHWRTLKKFETTWQMQQPASFNPIFDRPASLVDNRIYPERWHNSSVQVLALQHVEIASLMLRIYDPCQPRLGLEASSAHRTLAARIRTATLSICGLALSNKKEPVAMVTGALSIALCGSYFEGSESTVQDAIVGFLENLENEHAWPTGSIVVALRNAWKGASEG